MFADAFFLLWLRHIEHIFLQNWIIKTIQNIEVKTNFTVRRDVHMIRLCALVNRFYMQLQNQIEILQCIHASFAWKTQPERFLHGLWRRLSDVKKVKFLNLHFLLKILPGLVVPLNVDVCINF